MRQLSDLKIGCTACGATHQDSNIPDIANKVQIVKEAGVFDYIDRRPPDEEFRALLKASEKYDLPVLSCGWFYTRGRDDALFEQNIHKAPLLGSALHMYRPTVWCEGRSGALGLRRTPDDNRLRPVPGALGQEAVLEGNRPVVSHFLGQGLPDRKSVV